MSVAHFMAIIISLKTTNVNVMVALVEKSGDQQRCLHISSEDHENCTKIYGNPSDSVD